MLVGWKYDEKAGWQPQFTSNGARTSSTKNVKQMLDTRIQTKRKSDETQNEKCATLRLHKQRKSSNLEQKEKFLRKFILKPLKLCKLHLLRISCFGLHQSAISSVHLMKISLLSQLS